MAKFEFEKKEDGFSRMNMPLFVYGECLQKDQLKLLCLNSHVICRATAFGKRIVFRGYISMEKGEDTEFVDGVLVDIEEHDLEMFEGLLIDNGAHVRKAMNVTIGGQFERVCMTHIIDPAQTDPRLPRPLYVEKIVKGYQDWQIDTGSLWAGLVNTASLVYQL